jgi:hypothetical protein
MTNTPLYVAYNSDSLYALNVLEGPVISECRPRHGIRRFCAFSNDRQSVDAGLNVHLLLDNCGMQQGCDREKGGIRTSVASACTLRLRVPAGSTRLNGGLRDHPQSDALARPRCESSYSAMSDYVGDYNKAVARPFSVGRKRNRMSRK